MSEGRLRESSPPDHTIRRATLLDAQTLSELGARTFAASFGSQNTPEDLAEYLSRSFSRNQIAVELQNPRNIFMIVEVGNTAIGYAKLSENSPPEFVPGDRPLELARIYIEPARIGKGLGSALMQAAIDTARDLDRDTLWLGVWKDNPRAIAFYTRWGFTVVGEQKFILGSDVQDDYVLALRLA